MSERNPRLLLQDILESTAKIKTYTHGLSYEQFIADDKTSDAVIRNFEIIGEAANRLPEAFKARYPSVDWARIRGFRNRIVHDYFGIDYQIVWIIRESYLLQLETEISRIFESL